MRSPSPLRWFPLAACALLAGCFFTEAPVFTPDDLVDPDPQRYHETVLVPDAWDAPVPKDPKTIPSEDSLELLLLEDGILREATLDVWTERVRETNHSAYAHMVVARVGGEEFLIQHASLRGDGGQYNVEPFYRVVPGKGEAPARALMLDEDWLSEHFVAPYDAVADDATALEKLPADDRALIEAQRRHGISLTNGRETTVHGPTGKLQAFMLDQKERIFRLGHSLRKRTPELLATLREQATARRLAWLGHSFRQQDVQCSVHRQVLAMEPHADAIPALAEGLAELKKHPKHQRMVEAEETAVFMEERGLARQLGRLVVERLLPEAEGAGHAIPGWHLSSRSLVLHLRVDLQVEHEGQPTKVLLWFHLTIHADGKLARLKFARCGGVAQNVLSQAGHPKLKEDEATLRALLAALREAALKI